MRALNGNQTPSGDGYVMEPTKKGFLVGVVDGLGHGERAAKAAKVAVAALKEHSDKHITQLFEICHRELLRTRGVVMSLATFDFAAQKMTWASVGNVQGILVRANHRVSRKKETLMQRGGVVGYRMPDLRTVTVPVKRGDTLVFSTDGIEDKMVDGIELDKPTQQIADEIFSNYHLGTDDALVLVARYLGQE